ncbi:hypothetical protein [Novosphingobium resinovorum]|uniref:hypothetical protein n=1 Tax=Novosphingobium resinovorum TaxID=158500 RepID=UPI002ED40DEE|nr:hypothetical protein [Novosphingobium resinovorum]
MTRIRLKPDTLDEENARFEQVALPRPLFLNSVPKSGTHLLRNVMRMFVPVADHYKATFIQWGNLFDHLDAFDASRNMLSWGHLLFSDASAVEAAPARKIILVRDPYTWVLARARFFVSEQFGDNAVLVKDEGLSVDALINLMITGIHQKSMGLKDMYMFNALGWMGRDTTVIRYEDMVEAVKDLDSRRAEAFFMGLFDAAGLAKVPEDWRERVRIGADRKQSGTARENLNAAAEIPDELTAQQKALVDFNAPGLRALLGYY